MDVRWTVGTGADGTTEVDECVTAATARGRTVRIDPADAAFIDSHGASGS